MSRLLRVTVDYLKWGWGAIFGLVIGEFLFSPSSLILNGLQLILLIGLLGVVAAVYYGKI